MRDCSMPDAGRKREPAPRFKNNELFRLECKMKIELDDQHLCEVFEILCAIPFEKATMHDWEPPTSRHPGIEQMLEQIAAVLNG